MRLHIRSIARITRQWFRERGIHTFKWPANSPDLNPIESIWCQMKDVIPKRYPEYLPQRLLEQAVLDVWNAISEHSLRAQFWRRCHDVTATLSQQMVDPSDGEAIGP